MRNATMNHLRILRELGRLNTTQTTLLLAAEGSKPYFLGRQEKQTARCLQQRGLVQVTNNQLRLTPLGANVTSYVSQALRAQQRS